MTPILSVPGASAQVVRACLGGARLAGGLASRAGVARVATEHVAALFPELTPARQAAVAREVEANRWTAAIVRRIIDRLGAKPLMAMTEVAGAHHLVATQHGRPRLVVAWHAGVGAALGAGLARLGQGGLLLREDARPERFGLTHVCTAGDLGARAAAFQRAVRHLRDGGLVALYLDVSYAAPNGEAPYTFLGRLVGMRSGPAALARLAGAAIVPATSRWEGGGLRLALHAPLELTPGAPDRAVTEALLAWWERQLRAHPGDLWPTSVRRLTSSPAARS